MKLDRRIAAAAVCVMAISITGCKKDSTGPGVTTRTHSVTTTVQVPANPTAPITLSTNDPESKVQVTFDVLKLQALVLAAGGPVTITMTDLAPVDFASLPASERAFLGGPNEVAALLFDIKRTSGAAVSLAFASREATLRAFAAAAPAGTSTWSIRNNSGRRCTPGVVDVHQVFGSVSRAVAGVFRIDDAFPIQNITGTTSDVNDILHFIMCWECPRVTGGS